MKTLMIGVVMILLTGVSAHQIFAAPADSQDEVEALHAAIDDEYKARATYRKVIEKFGSNRPFSNIIGAEGRHIGALESLFESYNLPVPADAWTEKAPEFDSVPDACRAGVQAEEENIALYDKLLAKIDGASVKTVFTNLQNASSRHLNAFKRCAG